MKDDLYRLLLCVAALDLPDARLVQLIRDFGSLPIDEIRFRVKAVQEGERQERHRSTYDPLFPLAGRSARQFVDTSVGERVERLLKNEAGLTTARAVKELSERLVEIGLLKDNDVPPLSRKSLRDWIDRLSQKIPAKEILRLATLLRNEHAHSPVRDWTLGGSKKE